MTVSASVRKIIDRSPFLKEMLGRQFLSCPTYAITIIDEVSRMTGKNARQSAIVMALRRYSEELRQSSINPEMDNLDYSIMIHTDIHDVNLKRNEDLVGKLGKLYNSQINYNNKNLFNVIMGASELSLVYSGHYLEEVEKIILGEEIIFRASDLAAVTMVFGSHFVHTPGVVYEAARKLAWEDINVLEIISTMTELTFIVKRTDSLKSYEVLQSFRR